LVARRNLSEAEAHRIAVAEVGAMNSKVRLAQMEKEAKAKLLEIEERRALIEGDFSITDAEKWRLKQAALEEERGALQEIVRALREKAALESDSTAREQMLSRADAFDQKLSGVNRSLGTQGPNPDSLAQQMTASLTGLQNQFGTTAQKIARGFTGLIGSAVDSVAESLSGLLTRTMDWGDALRNIATTMGTAVINAISRMFAEWLVGRAMMAMKNILFSKAEGAADLAAKLPGAAATSISSWGIAGGRRHRGPDRGHGSGGRDGHGRPRERSGRPEVRQHRRATLERRVRAQRRGRPVLRPADARCPQTPGRFRSRAQQATPPPEVPHPA
jgi:hypothetical protein